MRTPTWEKTPGALLALLNSRAPLAGKVDLWTVTLGDGTVLRWSGADSAYTINGNTFQLGPGLKRTKVRFTVGLEVDAMTLEVTDIMGTTINGVALPAFIRGRGFDGASIKLERAFWGVGDTGPVGTLLWFLGTVDEADGDRHVAKLKATSLLKMMQVPVPRDVYQGPCLNVVFDTNCGLSRAAYKVSGVATGPTNSYRTAFTHAMAQAAGYFTLGVITMTSGLNTGISRTVRMHTSTTFTALQPWPFAVAAGDTFDVTPGCDGTSATCTSKFNNKPRFRGQPLIPTAETVL